MLLPTRSSVCWMRRHCGIMRCNSPCRFALASRYSFSAAVCASTSDLWMSAEQRADGQLLAVELRDDLDGFDPRRRLGRHFRRVLMIVLDPRDRLAQRALQPRIADEVAMDAIADAHELALDDALLRFAARREQDLVVALHELLLGRRDGLHGESQNVVQRLAERQQHVVCRAPGEIEDGHSEHDPQEDREARIGSDLEKTLERHDWQPRCRRFPVRPVALRPFLSEGVPLAVAAEHRPQSTRLSNESA